MSLQLRQLVLSKLLTSLLSRVLLKGSGGRDPCSGKEGRILIPSQAPPAQGLGLCSFLSCPLALQVTCLLGSGSLLPVPLVSRQHVDPFTRVRGPAALPNSSRHLLTLRLTRVIQMTVHSNDCPCCPLLWSSMGLNTPPKVFSADHWKAVVSAKPSGRSLLSVCDAGLPSTQPRIASALLLFQLPYHFANWDLICCPPSPPQCLNQYHFLCS